MPRQTGSKVILMALSCYQYISVRSQWIEGCSAGSGHRTQAKEPAPDGLIYATNIPDKNTVGLFIKGWFSKYGSHATGCTNVTSSVPVDNPSPTKTVVICVRWIKVLVLVLFCCTVWLLLLINWLQMRNKYVLLLKGRNIQCFQRWYRIIKFGNHRSRGLEIEKVSGVLKMYFFRLK